MHKFPRIHAHLTQNGHKGSIEIADMLTPVFTSLFTNGAGLGLDEITRLWDVYVFEGDAVLVRAGIALLGAREQDILNARGSQEVLNVMNGRSMMGSTAHGSKEGAESKSSHSLFGGEDEWMLKVRLAGKC